MSFGGFSEIVQSGTRGAIGLSLLDLDSRGSVVAPTGLGNGSVIFDRPAAESLQGFPQRMSQRRKAVVYARRYRRRHYAIDDAVLLQLSQHAG